MKNSNFIHGRVAHSNRQGAVGFRVRLYDARNQPLGESITGKSGDYNIWFNIERRGLPLPNRRNQIGYISVFGKGDRLIGKSPQVNLSDKKAVNISLSLIRSRIPINPVAEVLEPNSNTFLNKEFYNTIATVVSWIAPPSSPAYSIFLKTALCPLPPMLFSDLNIMDTVMRTLGNDRKAAILLKSQIFNFLDKAIHKEGSLPRIQENYKVINEILGIHGAPALNTAKDISYKMQEIIPDWEKSIGKLPSFEWEKPEKPDNEIKMDFRDEGFGPGISKDNIVPLYTALIQSAKTKEELSLLLLGVKAGLRNIHLAHDLYKTSMEVVQGGSISPMRMMLMQFRNECGPDDGRWPFPIPLLDIWGMHIPRFSSKEIEILECTLQNPSRPHILNSEDLAPKIASLSPQKACPGDTITIKGENFHPQCHVRFSIGSGEMLYTPVASVTDTELTVIMPPNAIAGPVDVGNPDSNYSFCGFFIPKYIYSYPKEIGGGRTTIHSFKLLRNNREITYAEPGETVQILWNVSPPDANIKITITNWNNRVVLTRDNLNPVDILKFPIPNSITREQNYKAKLEVTGSCGGQVAELVIPVSIRPTIKIEAVEFTQGIQNFSIAEDGPNDVELISNKGTIVRVYVSCNRNGFNNDETEITGRITIDGNDLSPVNGRENTREVTGGNPFITARPKSDLDRTETNHSLNFFIPEVLAQEEKTLEISISSILENVWETTDRRTISFEWIPERRLNVRWVRIRMVQHGNQILGEDQAEYSFMRAIDLLASTNRDVNPAPIDLISSNLNLSTEANRSVFMDNIREQRDIQIRDNNLDGSALFAAVINQVITFQDENGDWRAVFGTANRPGNVSWSAPQLNTDGENSDQRVTTAHELAHNLGFSHVGAGAPGSENSPNAGDIDHPNDGFLGDEDVPFDCFYNTTIVNRNRNCLDDNVSDVHKCDIGDFMSYFRPRRPSIHQWNRLINIIEEV